MMGPHSKEFYDLVYNINHEFYEQVYQNEWFKQVFRNVAQEVITKQQTDFIVQAFGGPQNYCGRMPGDAHPHIYVDEYMWELRETYLKNAFEKTNAPTFLVEKWLKIDHSFKQKIVKKSVDELRPRFTTDDLIIVFQNDKNKVA